MENQSEGLVAVENLLGDSVHQIFPDMLSSIKEKSIRIPRMLFFDGW